MNDTTKAHRKAETIFVRDFGDGCKVKVRKNRKLASGAMDLLSMEPFGEEERQKVRQLANQMVGFDCPARAEQSKQSRRNAREIRKALPDKIPPHKLTPDRKNEFHTNMLKMGPSRDYLVAPVPTKKPGYSLFMTLAALDMSDRVFDQMLAAMVERGHRTCVFYIRSGKNCANVFGRRDFDCWADRDRIIDRCDRMLQAGIAPCPVLMSNDDKSFNGDWTGSLFPRIRALLTDLHTRRNLVDRVLLAIEIDKSWNQSLNFADKPFFGVRMVMDTLGGDADEGGLKTIHYPDVFWWGHQASNWCREHNLDTNLNYVGPKQAGLGAGGKFAWFDGMMLQQNPQWGQHVGNEAALTAQLLRSYKLQIPAVAADGCVMGPFEYGQEPWVTEDIAGRIGKKLVAVSRLRGVGDSYGTGMA